MLEYKYNLAYFYLFPQLKSPSRFKERNSLLMVQLSVGFISFKSEREQKSEWISKTKSHDLVAWRGGRGRGSNSRNHAAIRGALMGCGEMIATWGMCTGPSPRRRLHVSKILYWRKDSKRQAFYWRQVIIFCHSNTPGEEPAPVPIPQAWSL